MYRIVQLIFEIYVIYERTLSIIICNNFIHSKKYEILKYINSIPRHTIAAHIISHINNDDDDIDDNMLGNRATIYNFMVETFNFFVIYIYTYNQSKKFGGQKRICRRSRKKYKIFLSECADNLVIEPP